MVEEYKKQEELAFKHFNLPNNAVEVSLLEFTYKQKDNEFIPYSLGGRKPLAYTIENKAFVKMLKEFPKAFGRVSFRERLMLRTAFTYVLEAKYEDKDSVVRQLSERCNQLLKDKGDLTDELAKWKEEWQEQVQKATDEGWERTKLTGRVRELEQQIEKMKICQNCDFIFRDGNCYYDKECKNKDHWKLRR
jgi:hypothetical protein